MKEKKEKLVVTPFDLNSIKPHKVIYIIGKRGTGKSVLLKHILYALRRRFDVGCAMAPTKESIDGFKACMPDAFVFENGHSEEALTTMQDIFKELARQSKIRNGLIVRDDCMADKKSVRSTNMRDLHMNGRHYWLTYIDAMQYLMDVGPELRGQVDYVFAMKEDVIDNQKKLYDKFFGIFPRFEDFQKVLNTCTDDFGALVLDRTSSSNSLNQSIFWFKAQYNLPPFKMFRPIFWKLNHQFQKPVDEGKRNILKPVKFSAIDEGGGGRPGAPVVNPAARIDVVIKEKPKKYAQQERAE